MEKQHGWAVSCVRRSLKGSLGWANSVSEVNRVSDIAPACRLCVSQGRVQKRNSGSALLSAWEKAVLSSCLDARHVISSSCMPLVPIKLLPWCWSSEEVSLSKSMCGLRGTSWDSRNLFYWLNPCCVLQPNVMGTYLPGTGTMGWGSWLVPEMSLQNFYSPHVGVGPAHSVSLHLCHSCLSGWVWFP